MENEEHTETLGQHSETPREVLTESILREEQSFALRLFLIFGILVGLLGILFFALPGSPQLSMASLDATETTSNEEKTVIENTPIRTFPHVELTAKSAYVLDLRTGETLFSKNATAQLPLASLTKLMTVLVAADLFKDTDALTISAKDLEGEGTAGLVPDESWLSRDLFTFTLTQSSNGAARAIASAAESISSTSVPDYSLASREFIARMNARARDIGLTQTYFINETGLDETALTGGGYGSARDAAVLMGEMVKLYPEFLEGTRREAIVLSTLDNQSHVAINTNQEIGSIPGLIGSKTGYTDLAGGNLVVAFDRGVGRPIIVAVLGSTRESRFKDVQTLVDATFSYLRTIK